MSGHEQFAEDLALYALGTLSGEDRSALEKHLETCVSCRQELEHLRGDMALLALSTAGPKPPQRARERFLPAIADEPRGKSSITVTPQPKKARWVFVPWVAAAFMTVVAFWFWRQADRLSLRVADLQRQAAQQQAQLERAREVVQTLTATDAMRVTLVAANTPPQPQGKAIYVRDQGSLIFLANNLPQVPSQKAYELWLIPVSGAPIPAGVFKPDAQGSATVVNPPLPPGLQAKSFAITIEPEAGSATPTPPIVMTGAGE